MLCTLTIRLVGSAALALGAALLVPSPVAAGDPGNPATGRLKVDVVGSRIPVSIAVAGPKGDVPDGYRATVTADRTLRNLTPGSYLVEPSPLVTPKGRPAVKVSIRQVTVRAGDTAKVTVTYSTLQPVRQLAAGQFTTCAVMRSGRVRCWGAGLLEGQWPLDWPTTVVKGVSDVRAVAVGSRNVCALRRDGLVKCWGNWFLGDGTMKSSVWPVRATGLDDVVAIEAGEQHSCALRANGRVRCWGMNGSGQLGTSTREPAATSRQVSGIRDAVAIAAGGRHTCALLRDGTVSCWGENRYGQLGNGTEIDATEPVQVRKLQGATAIAAGGQHTCAVLRDHTMKCWGLNENGQLGDDYPYMEGDDRWATFPVKVMLVDTATSVSAGSIHTCARLQGGAMKCWGNNTYGQLGRGSLTGNENRPAPVLRVGDARSVTAGVMYTCAARSGGKASCWGENLAGQLGVGTGGSLSAVPLRVLNFGS